MNNYDFFYNFGDEVLMSELSINNEMHLNEFNEEGLRKIAKEIVLHRFFLILHVLLYIFVNLLLFIINYLTNWEYPWFLWALIGWAVILFTHIFYYILYKKGIVHIATLALLYHVWAFIVLNSFLLFINFFTNQSRWNFQPWFWFPFGSWGSILIIHTVLYFYITPARDESTEKTWIERKVEQELKKLKIIESSKNLNK